METLKTGTTSGIVGQLIGQGAEVLPSAPSTLDDVPSGKTLVCIFDNGRGEQAVIVNTPEALVDMNPPNSGLPRIFALVDTTKVQTELAEEPAEPEAENQPEPQAETLGETGTEPQGTPQGEAVVDEQQPHHD